jgi:hypothetical protein
LGSILNRLTTSTTGMAIPANEARRMQIDKTDSPRKPPKLSWRDRLAIHPAAELFPLMSADELKELADDIKAHGLKQRIVFWAAESGTIRLLLDGRNRLAAMELAGLPTDGVQQTTLYGNQGVDPVAYVISANLRRRHLTAEQRRELIAKLIKATPEKSDRQIAREAASNRTTVGQVRKDLEGAGDVSTIDTRIDTKGREQPAHKASAPSSTNKKRRVSEIPTTPEKRTSGLPTGSAPQQIGETEPNPIIAAWRTSTREERLEFCDDRGADVVERFISRARHKPGAELKYQIHAICDRIEIEIDDYDDEPSEQQQEWRAEYQRLADELQELEVRISDHLAEEDDDDDLEEDDDDDLERGQAP